MTAPSETMEYLQRITGLEQQIERATMRAVVAERRVFELEDTLAKINVKVTGPVERVVVGSAHNWVVPVSDPMAAHCDRAVRRWITEHLSERYWTGAMETGLCFSTKGAAQKFADAFSVSA